MQKIIKRPPGRPRTGRLYAASGISLDHDTWRRLDRLAEAHGTTRHAIMRSAILIGLEQQEREREARSSEIMQVAV